MPLIDAVIELTVKQKNEYFLLVAEKDGTEYEFSSDENQYIENETLSVRVTGFDRNLELGKKSRLHGVVIASELKLTDTVTLPATMVENGFWDPVWLYGPTAAKDFFPEHYDKKWRLLSFDFTYTISDEDNEIIRKASDLLRETHVDETQQKIGSVLGKYPGALDLYHIMGVLSLVGERPALAKKYFQLGILLSESVLPDTEDFILDYKDLRNNFYISHMHSLANLLESENHMEEAISLYKKIYQLAPQDATGVRYALTELTGKPYPQTDDSDRDYPVDPYLLANDYSDFPLRDGYDPNSKTDYEKWLSWEESYRYLLISNAHRAWFIQNQLTEKDALEHLTIHDLAETSLARNDYPELRLNLARGLAQGQKRHDIIHQIGQMIYSQLSSEDKE